MPEDRGPGQPGGLSASAWCYSWSRNRRSPLAFCKLAPLPLRRHLDPILGLPCVPLCLSSLRSLKIHFSSFQLSHFPPPPPPLLDTPGSRKEPCPKSLAPPGQLFSKCQTLRNVGREQSGRRPRVRPSPVPPGLCFPSSLRRFHAACAAGSLLEVSRRSWRAALCSPQALSRSCRACHSELLSERTPGDS